MHSYQLLLLILINLVASGVQAERVDYVSQIKPILKARCYACHGALKQEADLRLDTGALVRKGGDSGPAISIDAPNESVLLDRLTSEDPDYRMPPIGMALSSEEIELFRRWIASGAVSPADELAEADPREHWAFKVPVRPELPKTSNSQWPLSPIDFFLNATYQKHNLKPVPDATPAEQLRRLYIDLTGLPPTPSQLSAFLDDPSDDNYKSIVDRLMDSPQYGERWGRHWMDIWRYSDWYGRRQQNDVRNSAPQIWRWRDWIVNSLNEDKSYARMVQEMLAADEIAADDDTAWPATGYLIRNFYSLNPNEWMRHNVEYTAKAFLGLTFNCAHCHDHKYDPIEHDDYFRMRAFFETIGIRQDRVLGEVEPPPFQPYSYGGSRKVVRLGMVRVYDEKPDAPTWFYSGGDERNKEKDRGSIKPGVPSFLNIPLREIAPINLPMTGWYPGSRPHIQQAVLQDRQASVAAAEKALKETEPIGRGPLEANVKKAQQVFDDAIAKAIAEGEAGALSGKQSVLLDASNGGRRILQQLLPKLKAVPEGTTISFRIRILKDDHVNFQLARDAKKHLTALFVGFVGGEVRAYRPGSFTAFVAGSYDFKGGQNDFDVRLVVQPKADSALLSVALHGTETMIATDVAIALNGWNAAKNPNQPMTFDCRTGSQALIDDVLLVAGEQNFSWDFEAPAFNDGGDVGGIEGWIIHSQSAAPASSAVSMIAACESARPSYTALLNAKTALKSTTLHRDACELGIKAAKLKLQAAQATIAADSSKRANGDAVRIEELSRVARDAQLAADEADARWRILDAQLKKGQASALPDSDKSKTKKVADLDKQLATAKNSLTKVAERRKGTESSTKYTGLSPTTAKTSTGRRTSLAYWITDQRNPLTPRVAINHIWLRHFNMPLVKSVYDFGRNGKPPTHPQLLDWLAVEFMENNWSMKHIHRLIVTSRAYRMSSSDVGFDANRKIDEDNRFLWRMNQGRMEAEVVRDGILFVAGKLDMTRGGQPLLNTQALTTFRRSLYYEIFPEDGGSNKLGKIFDPPDPTECFRRTSTIVPQQALALSNSEIIHSSSADAAKHISQQVGDGDDNGFINSAFTNVLSRHPSERELAACQRFLVKQRQIISKEDQVRESLVRVLFNHNDFITIR